MQHLGVAMTTEPVAMAKGSACERCGTFAELWSLTPRLCPACQQRLLAEKPFWTSAYLIGLGAVLNPTGAAVLAALNFKRLGDEKAARTWTMVALVFGVFYGVLIAADLPIPNQVLWPAGVSRAGSSASSGIRRGRCSRGSVRSARVVCCRSSSCCSS